MKQLYRWHGVGQLCGFDKWERQLGWKCTWSPICHPYYSDLEFKLILQTISKCFAIAMITEIALLFGAQSVTTMRIKNILQSWSDNVVCHDLCFTKEIYIFIVNIHQMVPKDIQFSTHLKGRWELEIQEKIIFIFIIPPFDH